MRIGFVTSTYWPIIGGMPLYVRHLARSLAGLGTEVRIATRFTRRPPASMSDLLRRQETRRTYREDDLDIHVLHADRLYAWLFPLAYRSHFHPRTDVLASSIFAEAFHPELKRVLGDVDLLHISGTGRELLGFAALHLAQKQGIPLFITPHVHIGTWGDSPLDLRLYRQADRIVALTHAEKEHLVSLGLPEPRVIVIGHGSNVTGTGRATWKAQHGIAGPLLLFLGRKTRAKGFHRLLRCLPEVWKWHPDAHAVLAGPETHESTRGLTTEERMVLRDKRVLNLPAVSEEEKENLLASCDMCCVPSEAEAFGMIYLEAWSYRKPVIALRIPTLVELFGRSGGGMLVDDEKTLAPAILRLLRNPRERKLLGNNGYAFARACTWPRVAHTMLEAYREVRSRMHPNRHVSAA